MDGIERRRLRRGQLDAVAGLVAADAGHGVHQEMDAALAPDELRADGVDEKRHVVVDDLDDRVLERPPVALGGGIEEADLRRSRRALLSEFPE